MAKFVFNAQAAKNFAVELRRASWGVTAFAGLIYFKQSDPIYLLLAAVAWFALQLSAFIADNLEDD
ncbi:MAG TPA: hypothetical protein PK283_06955 [Thiotrichales bacterium]|jgi:hypothetical protein|nr:MAG: hypothetical protein B7Y68_01980 [Thiotrichales bacterium 35-46-9]HQR82629.1 hypothetical protein [Thiotrichales bacterium]HQR95905.1 hypothetical protein [Thiotrichales bacterium]